MVDRVAIVSSPRSGNTWLRYIVRDSLDLPEVAVHNYADLSSLPDRCVLQLHWYREPNFQRFLNEHGFRIVTLARHPLDTLLSVLHFIRHEPATAEWLGGNCDLPAALVGKSPASEEFLAYALGFGAENLLSVSYQWWHDPQAIKLRYEDLVSDGPEQIRRVAHELGSPADPFLRAFEGSSFETFRGMPNRHGWQGRPGLWKELIPEPHVALIADRHRHLLDALGYGVDATGLATEHAQANWAALLR